MEFLRGKRFRRKLALVWALVIPLWFAVQPVNSLPPTAQGQVQCSGTLSADDIAKLIEGGVPEARLELIVGTCKVDFELTDALEQRFRTLGATDAIILAIVRNPQAPEPPTLEFRADKLEVQKGELVRLSWTSSFAKEVALEPGFGKVEANGSQEVSPQQDTNYHLVALGPGGKAERDVTVTVHSPIPDFQHERTLTGHKKWVFSIAFSSDGSTLATGSYDKTVKLLDPQSGQQLLALTDHSKAVRLVAFSPDGSILATGSNDKTIKLWDTQSGRLLRTLTGHGDTVYSVAFSPDGSTLATSSNDKTVKLWEVSTGRELRTLTSHKGTVYSVAFSPDGQLLASGSGDKTIKLWNPKSGRLLRTLTGHGDTVYSVAFSPDGQLLASGSGDKTVKLWRRVEE